MRIRNNSLGERWLTLTAGVIALFAMVFGFLTPPAAQAAEAPLPDGLSEGSAAGSCWEIKQNHPSQASGIYWLLTPSLGYPQQFYCDQETDGGGWVLVGRGREGWKEGYNGLRTAAQIRNTPSGTGAFAPAQLPAATVDSLLDGARVDSLPDGIRLRRATEGSGTQWQEARFKFLNRDRWVWSFGAEHRVGGFSFGGQNGSGGQTNNFGSDQQLRRVVFNESANHNYLNGFAFGSSVGGSTSSTTYLWAPSGRGNARPFTQMFLRPQLRVADLDFGTIPDSGAPATTNATLPDSNALTTSWGVSGFANGNSGELNTEVATFGETAGKVFVGGNFKFVQRNESGSGQVQQSNLAAFDVDTGQWVSSFRPTLNGQVKAVEALPDGRLAVGGQFSQVNGTAQPGLAFLDPNTGALSGPQVVPEQRTTGGVAYVRDLDVQSGYLYVAGAFTHLRAAGSSSAASTWNGGRVNLNTGTPDTNWNALLNGTSVAVDASAVGDRTYYAGYFKMKGQTSAPSAAAVQTGGGAPLATPLWVPTFSKSGRDAQGNITGNVWQLGVAEAGDKVWVGGSEHSLFAYDRNTFELVSGSITKTGGDFQTVQTNEAESLVIGGCHCGHWVYQDAYSWSSVGNNWSQGDKINLVGAWDAETNDYVASWSPTLQARAGYGAWGSMFDSNGVLWIGGDFNRSVRAGEVAQWSGGYVRFAPLDSTAPTTPGALTGTTDPTTGEVTLNWGVSSDSGGVTYEVIKENRVIASVAGRSYTAPASDETARYFVRARDAAENRSASTPVLVVEPPSDTALVLVDNGETWSWRYSSEVLPTDWAARDFDDSSWLTGKGVLARGVSGATTNIDPNALSPRPLSAQFRKSFQVQDAATVTNAQVSVIANDGVAVFLNGTELGRTRLPSTTLTRDTYASGVVSHSSAAANRVVYQVPRGLLVEGENVLAATVHANYRTTPDLSFDLALTGERGEALQTAAVTALTATTEAHDKVTLAWTPGTGGEPPTSYVVTREGVEVATVAAPETSFADGGLAPETTYEYTVTAVSALAGPSAPQSVSVTTPVAPAPPEAPLPVALLEGVATTHDSVALSWVPGEGGIAPASYSILRDGVAVGTVTAPETAFQDSGLVAETTYEYTVIAIGVEGGTSEPSTIQVTTQAPPPEPEPGVTIGNGEAWAWRYDGSPLPAEWNSLTFDASTWAVGNGLFGRGVTGSETDVEPTVISPRPLSAQFRKTFEVASVAGLTEGTVSVIANDGVVVYLNGVELGRTNLPAGTLTRDTYATAVPRHATAAANQVTYQVPVSLLVEGTNVLAASVHANYRGTPDLSFDLTLTVPRNG